MMKIWFMKTTLLNDDRSINGWDLCSGKRNGKAKASIPTSQAARRGAAEMVLQTISASKGEAHHLPWKGLILQTFLGSSYLYYTDLFSP